MKKSEAKKITEAQEGGLAGLILDAQPKLLGESRVRKPSLNQSEFLLRRWAR